MKNSLLLNDCKRIPQAEILGLRTKKAKKGISIAEQRKKRVQNQRWCGNIFDSMGSYFFCQQCLCKTSYKGKQYFSPHGVIKQSSFSSQRLRSQRRSWKGTQPLCGDTCTLPNSSKVDVCYQYEHRSLFNKAGNCAKTEMKQLSCHLSIANVNQMVIMWAHVIELIISYQISQGVRDYERGLYIHQLLESSIISRSILVNQPSPNFQPAFGLRQSFHR